MIPALGEDDDVETVSDVSGRDEAWLSMAIIESLDGRMPFEGFDGGEIHAVSGQVGDSLRFTPLVLQSRLYVRTQFASNAGDEGGMAATAARTMVGLLIQRRGLRPVPGAPGALLT